MTAQKTQRILVLGNGVGISYLDTVALPSDVLTVGLNRVCTLVPTDIVVTAHQHYLDRLPDDYPSERIYCAAELRTLRPVNRIAAPVGNTLLAASRLLQIWGYRTVAGLGFEGLAMGTGERYCYDLGQLKERAVGTKQLALWRQQHVQALKQTGVYIQLLLSYRELAAYAGTVH